MEVARTDLRLATGGSRSRTHPLGKHRQRIPCLGKALRFGDGVYAALYSAAAVFHGAPGIAGLVEKRGKVSGDGFVGVAVRSHVVPIALLSD